MGRLLLLLGAWLLLGTDEARAQRNLPGGIALQAEAGMVDGLTLVGGDGRRSFYAGAALQRTVRSGGRWSFALEYLHKDYRHGRQVVPRSQFTVGAGYLVPLLRDRGRHIGLNAGAAAVLGYETINWGERLLYDGATLLSRAGMLYGAALWAELEGYLSDRVALFIQVRERALWGTDAGNFHTLLGVGIRITIN